jgi:alkylation response protein AidB-like acyl-CoA dehydrogenase
MSTASAATRRGGDWLTAGVTGGIFTPERLSDEHRLVGLTAAEFVANEVEPAIEKLDAKDWVAARNLVLRCGELGLIGVDTPERFGGVGLDKAAAVVVGEAIGAVPSFAMTFGAQSGLAIVPILCFGSAEQQQRYLPKIVSGDWLGAYCLSESGAGSDALGVRTRATRAADGSWRLTGEKMWITNGAFADVFIVFAKVDGDAFTAFIVERGFAGVSAGKEEHKMGLHGSSTTPVLLADAHVPAANVLGEIGRGHKVAFNVLNYGRFKIGAMCTGAARATIAEAAAYALSRRQFGEPLASFGAIRHKLAEMTTRLYAVESMLYRTAGLIDAAAAIGGHEPHVVAAALEEFALESSLLKVAGSEMIDFVVDENVQIHGGNGFVRDYAAERRYRDTRVYRIFEGTNEINRLLVPTLLIKRARKGGPPVLDAAARALRAGDPAPPAAGSGEAPDVAHQAAAALKQLALWSLGLAADRYGDALGNEQEVLMLVADLVIDAYAADSAALRAAQAKAARHPLAEAHADAAAVVASAALDRAGAGARTVGIAAGTTPADVESAIARLARLSPVDTIAARRRLAAVVADRRRYPFQS